MTYAEAIHILELLMEGIHPVTGKYLSEELFSEPDIIFSIRLAIRALRSEEKKQSPETEKEYSLENYCTKRNQLNAGRLWTPEDDKKLKELFQKQASIDEMCSALQRRPRGLNNRLEYLGMIPLKTNDDGKPVSFNMERAGKPWYPEEDQKLREMFDQQKPLEEMAKALKRSERGVQFRLERLQLIDHAGNYPETDEQTTRKDSEDLKKRYLSGQSIAEIAAAYHLSEKAILARLFYLGLSSRSPDLLPERD